MNWKIHRKRAITNSRYDYYKDKCCFLIIKNASTRIILTPATFELLGKPKWVLLLSQYKSVGIRKIDESDPQFAKGYAVGSPNEPNRIHYISATSFVKENGLVPNTVCENVYLEGDILVAEKEDFKVARFKA